MELAGNEKKLQALFSELKLADEHVAPEFIGLWNRAQANSPGRAPIFRVSFAMATALFVVTLSALVLWSRNWKQSQPSNPVTATRSATLDSTPAPLPGTPTHPGVTERLNRVKSNRWDRKVLARRDPDFSARNVAIREAVSISTWQSPTAMLMRSPAESLLTSLPQLDSSLAELKTFLPNTPQ